MTEHGVVHEVRDVVVSALRLFFGTTFLAMGVALFAGICVLLLPSRRARIVACNVFGKTVGRGCLMFMGANVPSQTPAQLSAVHPAIYVSNHTSIIDVFLGMWISPIGTCGVAKKEVIFYPFLGLLYLISGHLRIDRTHHQRAVGAMKQLATVVRRHGLGIWIWPEGTRSIDGALQPFKKGFVHLAMATGLPVVPVVVRGAHHGWRKNSLKLQGATVCVDVLPPIATGHWTPDRVEEHVEEVHRCFRVAMGIDGQRAGAGP